MDRLFYLLNQVIMVNKQAQYESFEFEPDDQSCLFLNSFRLIRVNCPFQVICICTVIGFRTGDKVKVEKVLEGSDSTLLYQIHGKLYSHYYFQFKPPTSLVITKLK